MNNDPRVEIAADYRRETDAAVLLYDGSREVWVPKSLLETLEEGKIYSMPYWFAKKRGLI